MSRCRWEHSVLFKEGYVIDSNPRFWCWDRTHAITTQRVVLSLLPFRWRNDVSAQATAPMGSLVIVATCQRNNETIEATEEVRFNWNFLVRAKHQTYSFFRDVSMCSEVSGPFQPISDRKEANYHGGEVTVQHSTIGGLYEMCLLGIWIGWMALGRLGTDMMCSSNFVGRR